MKRRWNPFRLGLLCGGLVVQLGLAAPQPPPTGAGPAPDARMETRPARLPEDVTVPAGGYTRQCGPVVYMNAYEESGYYQSIGAGARLADDCWLTVPQRGICEVYSNVYNAGPAGNTVTLEIWDGCPQDGGTLLAVSPAFSLPGSDVATVSWSIDPPLPAPNRVWVAWTSPYDSVGPLISDNAEIGFTDDRFGTDDCGGGGPSCYCWFGGAPYAGFDVTISAVELPCACCLPDDTCVDLLLADCEALGGTWYPGAYCDTFTCPPTCPPGSLYGQPVVAWTDFWNAYTSDKDTDGQLMVFDNFSGLGASVCDLHFWGTQGHWGDGWTTCSENPMTFEIRFYQDAGGTPGTEVCAYTLTLTGTDTGIVYPGAVPWPLFEYHTNLESCCSLAHGWLSIQAVGDPSCWFLWFTGYGPGDGAYAWSTSSGLEPLPDDMAFCLTGPALELHPVAVCFQPGDTVTVELRMSGIGQTVVGGQFFLAYDTTHLAFAGAEPGDPTASDPDNPFENEIYEAVDPANGLIDYAVGVPDEDGTGTADDVVMARLMFTVSDEFCRLGDLLAFRAYEPPTRLSGAQGEEILPALLDTPVITVDGTPPQISGLTATGGAVDENCQATVEFSATVTDNCCLTAQDVDVALDIVQGTLGTPVITIVQVDEKTVSVSGSVVVSELVGCPATVTVTVDATDCCGNVASAFTTADVNDVIPPEITCSVTGGAVDENCQATVEFSATVTDNCCVDAADVTWTTGVTNGTLSAVSITAQQNGPDQVLVSGTAVVSDLTACPAVVTFTVNAVDCCGNEAETCESAADVYDATAPEIACSVTGGMVDENCQATVEFSATVTDNCCVDAADVTWTTGVTNGTLSAVSISSQQNGPDQVLVSGTAVVSDLTACPAVVTFTVNATDCCDNSAESCEASAEVNDVTPPTIQDCPADITVNADAGTCTAQVWWTEPTASDNCTLASFSPTHSPGDTFPQGTTTVTYTAVDQCGNTSTCSFDVTVMPYNELVVTVELSPNIDTGGEYPQMLTRCITFELWDCDPLTGPVEVQADVDFTVTEGVPNVAIGTATLANVPCGTYECITARDTLHTLRSTTVLTTDGTEPVHYVAEFTGDRSAGGHWLVGGNLNDDFWIDILDFGVYTSQYLHVYDSDGDSVRDGNTTCGPPATPYPHADLNGDGLVNAADFTFIQVNFLWGHEPNCCGQPQRPVGAAAWAGPVTSITVAELEALGLGELAAGDLNGDGRLDTADMAAFMQGARPKVVPQPAPDSKTAPPGRR